MKNDVSNDTPRQKLLNFISNDLIFGHDFAPQVGLMISIADHELVASVDIDALTTRKTTIEQRDLGFLYNVSQALNAAPALIESLALRLKESRASQRRFNALPKRLLPDMSACYGQGS